MSLRADIDEAIKTAMKAKDKLRLETVRSIKKLILEKEVEARAQQQQGLTPEQEIDLLSQLAKQRRDAIAQYEQAGRHDLASLEAQELVILETYLPQQLTEHELEDLITAAIKQVGATSPKEMGKVMGSLMPQIKGRADGKKVQEQVKLRLGE